MARLPQPGGDDGTWGNLLNDFLAQEHNTDGTLKIKTDGTLAGKANDNAVVHLSGNETVAGVKTFSSSPIVPSPTSGTQATNKTYVDGLVAGGSPDATTTSKGIVQLAGDLAGTATSPSVPGLAGKVNTSTVTTKGDLLAATGSGTLTRQGVGSNGQVLIADSAQSTGLTWSTVGSSSLAAGSIDSTKLADGAVTDTKLADGAVTNTKLGAGAVDDSKVAAGANIDQSKIANLTTDLGNKLNSSEKGVANGVAQLDSNAKVTPGQLYTNNISKILPYSYLGSLSVSTGTFRLYNDTGVAWTIRGVRASVGTAPAGASLIVDIHKNGTTIFTTQANRPTIAAAANTSGNVTTMDVTTVANGEYLTVDVDQIGTTTTGSDLTVQLEVY